MFGLVLLFSCSNNESVNDGNNSNTVSGAFTVNYEIFANSIISSPGSGVIISYTNGSGQLQTDSFSGLMDWNKTINVTSNERPLTMNLSIKSSGAKGYLTVREIGTLTQSIYINGSLKASNINTSSSKGSASGNILIYRIASSPINYVVK